MNKLTSTNPSKNYTVIGEVDTTSQQELKGMLTKARKAQPEWAALSQVERNAAVESFVRICQDHSDDIATIVSQEMGKPITSSKNSMPEAIEYFHAFMEMAETAMKPKVVFENETEKHTQVREPLGVLACITPWNFPFYNIPFQFGTALLTGNAVLYKPSEEIVLFGKLIEGYIFQSEIPEGIFSVVFGDGAVGEQLVQMPVDGVLFTGSTRTGQRITELAAKRSIPVLTEMGGSSPGVIFEDADVPAVIKTVYGMRMANSGQFCDGLKRLIVHESKLEEVLDALKNINATKKVGDASEVDTDFGPLVAKRQVELLEDQVEDARSKGAQILFGGKKPEDLEGAYYEPTVLTNITFDMKVWKEEVFGPVLPVVSFKTEEEAVRLANDTIYGLSAFVFTSSKERYWRVAKQLQAGAIGHNNALYFSPMSPFGGYKASGNGRVCGTEGFHEVTQVKLISEEK